MTYKAVGRSIMNYPAPVWRPNLHDANYIKILNTQNEALTRHRNTAEPMVVVKDRKATLKALHTDAVNKAVKSHERNVVLDGRPPPISNSVKYLTRKERSTLAQLRSGYCELLQ